MTQWNLKLGPVCYSWILFLYTAGLCRCYAFQPDGDLGSLGQSVPGTLQPRVDLSHLNDPFQSHYLQALVAYVCGASTRTTQVRTRQSQPRAWRGGLKHHVISPCVIVLRRSGSVKTPPSSTSGKLSAFLDSPQRLEPPCMLGMLRTAMPSRHMLPRSRGLPQHWPEQNTRGVTAEKSQKCIVGAEPMKKMAPLSSDLDRQTIFQLLAGGKDGLRGGELKIPKFVLHSESETEKDWFETHL